MFTDIANIACEPPLGCVTTVEGSSATFSVGIEIHESKDTTVKVIVWCGQDGDWSGVELKRIGSDDSLGLPQRADQSQSDLPGTSSEVIIFRGTLDNNTATAQVKRFTLKILIDGIERWINDFDPQPDGVIVLQGPNNPASLEGGPISHIHPWHTERTNLGDASVSSWVYSCAIDASTTHISNLGSLPGYHQWFAIVRHSTPWLGPRQGEQRVELDKPGILISLLLHDGAHLVIIPENGRAHLLNTLQSSDNGNLEVHSRNDAGSESTVQVFMAIGKDFESTLAAAVKQMKSQLPGFSESTPGRSSDVDEWYDGLSYCTWNGIGRELSEAKLQNALLELSSQGLTVPNLIIDDNWQSLDNTETGDPFTYRWTDFEANAENFPHGLRHTISATRKSHPYLRNIAVWHGIFGYWGGFSPGGRLARSYESREVEKQTQELYMSGSKATVVTAKDVHMMYDDFYLFLRECGVDSVKADNGFYPDYVDGTADRRELIYSYQDAFMAAAEKHFQHRAMSCMSQTPQILFHSFLDDGKRPPYLVRNSDDFFPDAPTSHTWHVFCNAHNSVLTQHLNLLPDWDMFQTAGQFPYMHAAARCLSGGPIYITDVPGQHDVDLIRQMTAPAFDGRLKILRPYTIGRATEVYNKPRGRRFLRVSAGHFGARFLGLFNLGDKERFELVTLEAITRSRQPGAHVVTRHYDSTDVRILSDADELVPVKLQAEGGHEIVTAHPIQSIKGVDFAVLGLKGKMTAAAVLAEEVDVSSPGENELHLSARVKSLGMLLVWIKNADAYLRRARIRASFSTDSGNVEVGLLESGNGDNVVGIDIEAAWAKTKMGQAEREKTKTLSVDIRIQTRMRT